MDVKIVAMGYEESRLEFFEEQKKLHEQKLHWWMHQKPYKQYSPNVIYEKCSEHGAAISYLEDAIRAFGGTVAKHGDIQQRGGGDR